MSINTWGAWRTSKSRIAAASRRTVSNQVGFLVFFGFDMLSESRPAHRRSDAASFSPAHPCSVGYASDRSNARAIAKSLLRNSDQLYTIASRHFPTHPCQVFLFSGSPESRVFLVSGSNGGGDGGESRSGDSSVADSL